MHIKFVLPDIQDIPTGGNIFNNRIIAQLRQYAEISVMIPGKNAAGAPADGAPDVVIVDSLLAAEVAAGDADGVRLLLVHLLPFFDPANEVEITPATREMLQTYDGCITTSHFSKMRLVEAGVAPGLVRVVYPGLDAGYRQLAEGQKAGKDKKDLADEVCRILTVSSLLPGKGLYEFVAVLEKLPASGWRWDLVGDDALDPAFADRLKARLKHSSVAEKVRWLGTVSPERMPACYAGYDLFVLPSRFETLGMAVREAMAAGLPVVAYDVGGISESLGEGGGVLVLPYDARQLGAEISGLVADGAKRRQLGGEAGRRSRAFPSWAASAEALAAWLKDRM